MSDTTPAFESPTFDNESDDDFDDDLDDDFVEIDHSEVSDDAADDVEAATEDHVDRVNQVEGGAAKAVAEHVARSIVDDPDAVVVDVAADRAGVRLSLHVAPGDMGRIIGKRGRVAQALRSLVRAAAAKDGTDASVDIVD
jgi:predicted RNA-binding protein YlqC (UPF0109 family)